MRLDGKKIVVLVAEGFEDLEYWVTVMRLREEGRRSSRSGRALTRSTARTPCRPNRMRRRRTWMPLSSTV